jgi:hypothetical protein
MISRYDAMAPSLQSDVNGSFYPDILSFPLDDLKLTVAAKKYRMTRMDVDRFDITVATEYGAAVYDDVVLWYNGIESIHDVSPGDILLFPDKVDLDAFMIRNRT